jgi:hypothetical protein
MRTTRLNMVAALLLVAAGAAAQDTAKDTTKTDTGQKDVATTAAPATGDFPLVNEIDLGVRGTAYGVGSDVAR